MNRRGFLSIIFALASNMMSRSVFAQPSDGQSLGAVVIGVDKPKDLPPLSAAASGAKMVADWLRADGYEVNLLVDTGKPVLASEVYDAIDRLLRKGTLQRLVVYFSGHGFLVGTSEFWLLSRAPSNPNEAINVAGSVEAARDCGIPHVIFISDACRSTADSLGTQSMRGYQIFPGQRVIRDPRAEVDRFYATLPGDPALEVPVAKSAPAYEGIYTSCFLSAFEHPEDNLVQSVDGMRVVPNRLLKPYLVRTVRKRAEEKALQLRQVPDAILESGEKGYIARVTQLVTPAPPQDPQASATLLDLASLELERVDALPPRFLGASLNEATIQRIANETGFLSARGTISQAQAMQFDDRSLGSVRTGFVVFGAEVKGVTAPPGVRVEGEYVREGQKPTLVHVDLADRAGASVALRFGDGAGTVVGALRRFVGTVVVADGRVVNVSYAPAERPDDRTQERLNELHAVVATAARFGVFRIRGDKEERTQQAQQLADKIRILKGVDPTLGLYAAYAYADAGLIRQVRSVRDIMRGDLGVDLFDVAMLAGALAKEHRDNPLPPTPFCPMLSQGWALLGVWGVPLQEEVEAARNHLRNALWTTFEAEGVDVIAKAMQAGKLL